MRPFARLPIVLSFCLVSLGAAGCAADLGASGGAVVPSGHAVAHGNVAFQTRIGSTPPLNDHGVLVGLSVDSRAEADVGSRWDIGLRVGYGSGPSAFGGRVGYDVYGEVGTPLRSSFGRDANLYCGAAFALPINLETPRQLEQLNDSTWILVRRLELVPLASVRLYMDDPFGGNTVARVDVTGGLAVRLRVFSDLF